MFLISNDNLGSRSVKFKFMFFARRRRKICLLMYMEYDTNANIINTRFHKSIIRSRSAMTYEEAQITIDDKSKKDSIAISLRGLNMLAKILKKRRLEKGYVIMLCGRVSKSIT